MSAWADFLASAAGTTARSGVMTIAPPSCTVTFTWSPGCRPLSSRSAASKIRPCELTARPAVPRPYRLACLRRYRLFATNAPITTAAPASSIAA